MPRRSTPSSSNTNAPLKTIRHRNIKAAIWMNSTASGPMYNVTISRSFKDGDQWRDSHSFGYDDLMNLSALMYESHAFISGLRARDYTAASSSKLPPARNG